LLIDRREILILDNIAISSDEILYRHFWIISFFTQKYLMDINVEIIEYDDHAKLQEDCLKQHQKTGWHCAGCSLVP